MMKLFYEELSAPDWYHFWYLLYLKLLYIRREQL